MNWFRKKISPKVRANRQAARTQANAKKVAAHKANESLKQQFINAQAELKADRSTLAQRIYIGLGLLFCMAGAVAISHFLLINNSLRLDESQSIWQVSHSFTGMLEVVAQDVHMPLYHIILQQWIFFFGDSTTAVRSLSMIFFLLTIPMVYLLSRQILSRRWALAVTALFSFSPFMNWYANEARMYTLLVLFATINQYFFARILKYNKGWWGYAISAIFGAYSHYFFMFNLLAQATYYLINHKSFVKGAFKRFVAVMVAMLIAISPWITYFVMQGLASNTRPLIERPTAVNFFNVYSQFLFGFQTDAVNTAIVSLWPLILIVAFFTVKRHLKLEKTVGYLLAMSFVPIVAAFALSFVVTPFFLSRYMVSAIAPLTIAIAWLISRYRRNFAVFLMVAWFGIVGATFAQQVNSFDTPVKENYSVAAKDIESHASIHDVIVISSPFTVYPFEYYYNGPLQIRTLPLWDRQNVGAVPAFNEAALPQQVDQLKQGHDYIYLLLSYDQGYEKKIQQYFDMRYEKTRSEKYSDGLMLYVYRVGYDTMPEILPTVQNYQAQQSP